MKCNIKNLPFGVSGKNYQKGIYWPSNDIDNEENESGSNIFHEKLHFEAIFLKEVIYGILLYIHVKRNLFESWRYPLINIEDVKIYEVHEDLLNDLYYARNIHRYQHINSEKRHIVELCPYVLN